MLVRFWGTRGSVGAGLSNQELREKMKNLLMTAKPENVRDEASVDAFMSELPFTFKKTLGGNTSCVQVKFGEQILIFDAGSGLRLLGQELLNQFKPPFPFTLHIFLSHFHWDHIQGFPFFSPAFIPGNKIRFYSAIKDAYALLSRQQEASYFPVKFEEFGADIEFITLNTEEPFDLEGLEVNSMGLVHPGSSMGYRVSDGTNSLVYMSDTELLTQEKEDRQKYIDFVHDADAVIVDSQYDFAESHMKKHWGHSSPFLFIDVLQGTGIKKIFMFHHDPASSDEAVYQLHKRAVEYKEVNYPDDKAEILIAIEGDEYTF